MAVQSEPTIKAGRPCQRLSVAVVVTAALAVNGCAGSFFLRQHPSAMYRDNASHMSEELRSSVAVVALRPSDAVPTLEVNGDNYEVPTESGAALQGAAAGAS